jgi:magnesium transporter
MITAYRWDARTRAGRFVPAEDLPPHAPPPAAGEPSDVWWVDLERPDEAEEQRVLGDWLPVHPLTREDVARPRRDPRGRPHLPKVEEFADYLFVVVTPPAADRLDPKGRRPLGAAAKPAALQLSAVLTHNALVTHHDAPLPAIRQLHAYLERHPDCAGRGPDFLLHLVLDEIVDEYAPLLDRMTDELERLEARAVRRPTAALMAGLLRLKRLATVLRKTLVLEREVLARLSRGEFGLIDARETAYYRNVYDHLLRYSELTEGVRDALADLMQTHLAAISNRLNEVMKALAMISTVVLPMTLVAGVYGMNFKHMPELDWEWGYPMALGLMGLTGLASFAFFRWKKWI